jgi:hypothetical protein
VIAYRWMAKAKLQPCLTLDTLPQKHVPQTL